MLEKTFDPKSVEPRLYAAWEASGGFAPTDDPNAEPFSIVIPPPNVTGSLHIGHALNNTLQDVLIRFERMRGKAALWLPGTDHAGIATQMVVERQLAEAGNQSRRDLGRDDFVAKIWEWKAKSGGTIVNQLKRLGASCDWSRERFTLDEGLSAAVRKVFVTLYKEKLIYRDKRLVNWDPHFQTAISDLEVEQREVDGHFWHFAYPLEDGSGEIVVATTRPETMLGDTAVAVHPSDERYKALIGRAVRLPIVNRPVPIIAHNAVFDLRQIADSKRVQSEIARYGERVEELELCIEREGELCCLLNPIEERHRLVDDDVIQIAFGKCGQLSH